MPFCPECRAEYVAGTKECNDCGVPLVDVLPPEVHEDRENLIPVYKADTEVQGEMILSLLKGEGIEAELYPTWGKGTEMFAGAVGRWGSVVVLEHEAERAGKIIQAFLEASPGSVKGAGPAEGEE
jgi:hypothetical protein